MEKQELIMNESTLDMPKTKNIDDKGHGIPTLEQLQLNLSHCLQIIDNELFKGYMNEIDSMSVVPVNDGILQEYSDVQFLNITELVYQENEFSPYKIASVYSALKNYPCSICMVIRSDGHDNEVYLGVRSQNEELHSTGTMRTILGNMITGQFPGTKTSLGVNGNDIRRKLDADRIAGISCFTGIADYKQEEGNLDNASFIQGMEKFISGMDGNKNGRPYTAILMADSISRGELHEIRKGYEDIYTQISPFANIQLSYSSNENSSAGDTSSESSTMSLSNGNAENITINNSHTDTYTINTSGTLSNTYTNGQTKNASIAEMNGSSDAQGESESTAIGHAQFQSKSVTISENSSVNTSVGIDAGIVRGGVGESQSVGAAVTGTQGTSKTKTTTNGRSSTQTTSQSISETLSYGISNSQANGISQTKGQANSVGDTESYAVQNGISTTVSNAATSMTSSTITNTLGNSQGITLNSVNMSLKSTLDKIEQQMKRIEECESVGMWNFSAYFLGESVADSESAACMYESGIIGNNSGVECSAINTWPNDNVNDEKTRDKIFENIYEYIRYFVPPKFHYEGFSYTGRRDVIITPASRVSSNELALQMGLPEHSVKGLPVTQHAVFAQEVISANNIEEGSVYNKLYLGNVYHLGVDTSEKVELDKHSLTMHTFITGSTGSGKSNTVYQILSETREQGAHFLVIEPAKGEYKDVFGNESDVSVYGTNPNVSVLLKLNPFSFPNTVHIFEHMERLVEIFNVCWPMYAAMPAVLKNAIEKSYVDCGWSLTDSTNRYGDKLYPCFADVAKNIETIIDSSEYDAENKGAYKGSLLTRLTSLTNGINGLIFTSNEIHENELFDRNVIIDLSRVGSSETKSLLMGILVLKLQEYRESKRQNLIQKGQTDDIINSDLKHLTVLEEAHNLLKRTSTEQPTEGGNLLGKSVEMLSNAIAEMRTYGEGFIIADQAPGLMDMSVIRNTNTKIIMRLPDEEDRELVGKAANLNDDQIKELAKLPCGVAAVYQNEWIEPVLCKVNEFKDDNGIYVYEKNSHIVNSYNPKIALNIADKLINHDSKLTLEELDNSVIPDMRDLGLRASTQVAVIKLLSESEARAKMTKLAPIIAELFPSVVTETAAVCRDSKDYKKWTTVTDNALKSVVGYDIDRTTNWGIIQLCIIYELINVENNEKAFRDWKHNGGLRW